MSVSGLMNATCEVMEFVTLPSRNMETLRVWQPVGAPLRCRVSVANSSRVFTAALQGTVITHRVYFDANPLLREGQRLRIGGVLYQLAGLPQNPSMAGRLWQLDVQAVTAEAENRAVGPAE